MNELSGSLWYHIINYVVFKLSRILDISVQDLVAAAMKLRVIVWGIVFN